MTHRARPGGLVDSGWWLAAGGALGAAAALALAGCVSLSAYRDLEEKYEHVVDAKLDLDREFVEARRQLLAVEEQHAQLGGRIAALEETVAGRIRPGRALCVIASPFPRSASRTSR
ncbi:hypothetical protein [Nitrospira calida]